MLCAMRSKIVGYQSWFAPSPPPAAALSPHAAYHSVVHSTFGLHLPASDRRFGLRPQPSRLAKSVRPFHATSGIVGRQSAFGLHLPVFGRSFDLITDVGSPPQRRLRRRFSCGFAPLTLLRPRCFAGVG